MICIHLFYKMFVAAVVPFIMFLWYSDSLGYNDGDYLDLPEGSSCVTTQNVTGTCVKMHTCTILIYDIMQPYYEKVYPDICSFDGDTPIICCTSCKDDMNFDNISDAVYAPSGILYRKSGRAYWDKCLEYSKYADYYPHCDVKGGVDKVWLDDQLCHKLQYWFFRTVGGIPADREEYTHMALLGYGPNLTETQWHCGGSLISENFILTAGHCTFHSSLGKVAYAALGILKRSDPEELWQTYKIEKIIPYSEYEPPSKYHDIALLKTETPVKFNRAVFPACLKVLPNPDDEYKLRDITAIGWGALGDKKPLADTLQVIRVQNFNNSECSSQYPEHRLLSRGYDRTTQMCYGDRINPVDTCQGDSGGPLQTQNRELCMYALIGVTSFGDACGYTGKAGMYTRLRNYVPWIEDIVWPDYYALVHKKRRNWAFALVSPEVIYIG